MISYRLTLNRRLSNGSVHEVEYTLERTDINVPSSTEDEVEVGLLADLEYQANSATATVTGKPFIRTHITEHPGN